MSHYQDPTDLKYVAQLAKSAPDVISTFGAFDAKALRDPASPIPRKYAELMALAVGLTTQCVYCIEAHTHAAKKEGASAEEIAATVGIAAALRAGAAVAHGALAIRLYQNAD